MQRTPHARKSRAILWNFETIDFGEKAGYTLRDQQRLADALIAAFPVLTVEAEPKSTKSALTPQLQDVMHPRSASVSGSSAGLTSYNILEAPELKLRRNPPQPSPERIAELLRLGGPDGVWRDGCDTGMVAP